MLPCKVTINNIFGKIKVISPYQYSVKLPILAFFGSCYYVQFGHLLSIILINVSLASFKSPVLNNVARKFEQKVAKFQKTPKDLHQSNLEKPKNLHRSSFKRQEYLHQSTKRQSQNQLFAKFSKVAKKAKLPKRPSSQKEILVANWYQKKPNLQ